jgi:hypothetical protein
VIVLLKRVATLSVDQRELWVRKSVKVKLFVDDHI